MPILIVGIARNLGAKQLNKSRHQFTAAITGACIGIAGLSTPAQAGIKLIREWKAAPVLLQNVEFSPDGKQLLTASGGGVAQLWALDGTPGPVMQGQRSPMFNAHFNRQGNLILTTSYNGTVGLWSADGVLINTLSIHKAAVTDARFIGDQGLFVSSSDDGQVVLRNAVGVPIWSSIYPGTARQLVVSDQGDLVVASSDNGNLHLVQLDDTGKAIQTSTIQTPHGRINQLSISINGDNIAASAIDGTVSVWNRQGTMLHRHKVTSKGWADGGMFCKTKAGPLLTVGDDGVIQEWSRQGQVLAQLKLSNHSRLTKVDCSPAGDHAAVVGSNGELWLLAIITNP